MIDIRSDEYVKMNSTMNSSTTPYWEMSSTEWSGAYNRQYVSGRGDLYVVIDRIAYSTSQQYNQSSSSESLRSEIRGSQVSLRELTSESVEWIRLPTYQDSRSRPILAHVAHAFSSKVGHQSRIQISLYFMVIVATFNLFKLAVMLLVLITDRSAYLVTLGDAAASFLKRPDPNTGGKCMLGKEEIFIKLGLLPLHPVSTDEEAKDLDMRSKGTWLPRRRPYLFSINRHGKVIYTLIHFFEAWGPESSLEVVRDWMGWHA